MGRALYNSDLQSVDPTTHATILANWFEAVAAFYNHYNNLAPCANKRYLQKGLRSIKNRNPFLINKLRTLLSKMKHELKNLLQDLEKAEANNLNNYKQLVAHTRVLNRLNREAETMRLLTSVESNN